MAERPLREEVGPEHDHPRRPGLHQLVDRCPVIEGLEHPATKKCTHLLGGQDALRYPTESGWTAIARPVPLNARRSRTVRRGQRRHGWACHRIEDVLVEGPAGGRLVRTAKRRPQHLRMHEREPQIRLWTQHPDWTRGYGPCGASQQLAQVQRSRMPVKVRGHTIELAFGGSHHPLGHAWRQILRPVLRTVAGEPGEQRSPAGPGTALS